MADGGSAPQKLKKPARRRRTMWKDTHDVTHPDHIRPTGDGGPSLA